MKNLKVIALIVCIVGIALFVIGATTGTITGYQGANGLFYSDPGAVSSNEWMCMPGLIMAIIGGIMCKLTRDK